MLDLLRRSEQAHANETLNRPHGDGSQWGDLLASLESCREGSQAAQSTVGQPLLAEGVATDAGGENSEALLRTEPVEANTNADRPAGPNGHWQELGRSLGLPPESFLRAERVFCQPRPEEHIVSVGQDHSPGQEVFRVLCYRLQQVRRQRALNRILVTSAVPREGKTVVAINVAVILARSSPRVLLVDADLRHSSVHHVLGLRPPGGLADLLEGKIELEAACVRLDPLGFYFLSSGQTSKNPAELLQKPKLQEFMNRITTAFDWVVLDSPPLNLFADARHLAMLADGVLFVAREDVTPRDALEQGLSALQGVFVAGIVLNASTNSDPKRYYDSYKGVRANGRGRTAPNTLPGAGGQESIRS